MTAAEAAEESGFERDCVDNAERYILRTSRLRREGAKLTRFVEEACARITEARIASLPQHRPVILYD